MAAEIGTSVATKVAETCIDRATKEAGYLCCFKSYVEDFEKEQSRLPATRESVRKDIEEARQRNENQIDDETEQWLKEVDGLIEVDTKAKKKCFFGLCTNCKWQYKRGKELAEKTTEIPKLMARRNNLIRVARSAGLPGMEYHYSPDFIHFESRKDKFEELKKALEKENNHMIGLQGMGGTGKTTMAIQVGKEVEESKLFDKVIFIVVSNPPDVKKIRDGIARHLGLSLEYIMGSEAESLWSRIVNGKKKVLIILDDVWEKLDLKDIGIPSDGCCSILLTTRDLRVCKAMRCHKTIQLKDLSDEDTVKLFLLHAAVNGDDSSIKFKEVAEDIVMECGKLPVAIVAVARTLNHAPLDEWQVALTRLKNSDLMPDVDEDMIKVYKSLSLSYHHLKNEKVKELFLLCSLFPGDFEIPIEFFTRIFIGLGLCEEADKCNIVRSQVLTIKKKLIDSCLLLKAKKECVKMHDLVREVAQWIESKKIQVVEDSTAIIKENIQYSSWNIDKFPRCFHGSKLEVLLILINAKDCLEVPSMLFEGMTRLRVLLLICKGKSQQIPAPTLVQSIQSLGNVQTLILSNWGLGDISIIGNLQSLKILELNDCSIIELPDEVQELKKLRLLGLRRCQIERNNPFEVIERCPLLEELYYVKNDDILDSDDEDGELPQSKTLLGLQRCHIMAFKSYKSLEVDASISTYFSPGYLKKIFSEATFRLMAARAEILELGGYCETGWTNLIPNIIPVGDGGMGNLIRLSLYSWGEIECLINTKHLQPSAIISSKLVELKLFDMDVKELCCGSWPVDFLKQLERLHLKKCLQLKSTLFGGKLNLGNLKFLNLENCSMVSLFNPPIAESLKQLETLEITECYQLKYIITDEGSSKENVDDHDPNQKGHGSIFPQLKFLRVENCKKLEFILPICSAEDFTLLEVVKIYSCEELKYIFGQSPYEEGLHSKKKEIILPSLKEMEIYGVPNFLNIFPECHRKSSIVQNLPSTASESDGLKEKHVSPRYTFSWSRICCFVPKSSATNIDNPLVSEGSLMEHIGSQVLNPEWVECFLRPPFYLCNLREMEITGSKFTSLFTLSIASSILLERLVVAQCQRLKHLVSDEEDGHHPMNYSSLFPNLRSILVCECNLLESLFPASHFRTPVHLEYVEISHAHNLHYVFGKCYCQDNLPIHLHLPALKDLFLIDVPNMVSICMGNCKVTALSLKAIGLKECPQLPVTPFIDIMVGRNEIQDLSVRKEFEMHPQNLIHLDLENFEINTIYDLERHQIARPVKPRLKIMRLQDLPGLSYICLGPKNILSLQNLFELRIRGCENLKVIFSAAICRRLPQLGILIVSDCKKLVQIIKENEPDLVHSHELCFPKLFSIYVNQCKSLKCLFSISTCGMLPKLQKLRIEDASELVQVFGRKQGDTEELVMEGVFPELSHLELTDLPNLASVCPGIDFQRVQTCIMTRCPKISITFSTATPILRDSNVNPSPETSYQLQEVPKHQDNKVQPASSEMELPPSQSEKDAAKGIVEKDLAIQEESNNSPNLIQIVKKLVEPSFHKLQKAKIASPAPFIPLQNESSQQIEASVGEGPSSEKCHIASSSTPSESEISHSVSLTSTKESMGDQEALRESKSTNDAAQGVDKPLNNTRKIEEPTNECSSKEGSNKIALAIPQTFVEMKDSTFNLVATSSKDTSPQKPQIVKLATPTEPGNCQPNPSDVFANMESQQSQIMINQTKTYIDEEIGVDHISLQQFERDDLITLFRIMEESAGIGVRMSNVSKIADNEVAKAFVDLEASFKMGLQEIASSEENSLRLQNALSFLSTQYCEDGAPSHGLKPTIESLHQEIPSIISSFRQASARLAAIDTFTEFEEKEKCINEELPQRKEAAITLVSEIYNTKNSMAKAQQKEAELKGQISRLQAELNTKENEIKDCEIQLSFLQEKKKKSISDTIGFLEEFEAVQKDRSQIVEDNKKARQELEKWSTCAANWWKATLLQGIYLKQKL